VRPTRRGEENHGKETITGKTMARTRDTRIEAFGCLPVRLSVEVSMERLE